MLRGHMRGVNRSATIARLLRLLPAAGGGRRHAGRRGRGLVHERAPGQVAVRHHPNLMQGQAHHVVVAAREVIHDDHAQGLCLYGEDGGHCAQSQQAGTANGSNGLHGLRTRHARQGAVVHTEQNVAVADHARGARGRRVLRHRAAP